MVFERRTWVTLLITTWVAGIAYQLVNVVVGSNVALSIGYIAGSISTLLLFGITVVLSMREIADSIQDIDYEELQADYQEQMIQNER